jgi:iron transport multicopper oxidase
MALTLASWVPLNGTDTLEIASNPKGNFSVLGLDTTDFNIQTQFVYSIPSIMTVDYLLNNLDEGTHPFHFHGHKFWIMASGDGDYNPSIPNVQNPVYRDTLAVQQYGYALIRFVSNNPGAWICKKPPIIHADLLVHCHISWHVKLPSDVN